MDNQNNRSNKNNPKNNRQGWGVILVTTLLTAFLVMGLFSLMQGSDPQEISYDKFLKMVDEKKVEKVTIDSAKIYITLTDEARKEAIKKKREENTATAELLEQIEEKNAGGERGPDYYTGAVKDDTLSQRLYDAGVEYEQNIPDTMSSLIFEVFITAILPLILIFLLMNFVMKRMSKGSGMMGIGKSNAKVYVEKQTGVTFQDVAGEDEAKESLQEVVDFLHNPGKYTGIGAKLPKGALLVGPPGTGKTLLAKAVAGEADVPFFSISGSDFVEMFVGTGASRVRDMFKKAQQTAPCIVFIDEIDAVGRQRGAGMGGGNDEREQTLNQLLVEMDGMGENKGIVIIAATNRPDVLDPALLRSGRFDRQITVNLPDKRGRYEILKVHARNKKLAPNANLEGLAKRTPGFSGADLENVLNEGAILAVRDKRKVITMEDLDEAIDRVMMGPAKKSKKYTDREKRLVAFHEAGHAVIGLKLDDADKVEKVTIIPRGEAGGYNLMTPKEEKMMPTKADFMAQITGLMGGRVAEEVMFDEVSAGASNDIQKATKIAKAMVRSWGMSSLGPIQYDDGTGNVFLGRDYGSGSNYSGEIAYEIDKEIRKIINECYDRAKQIIEDNKDLLTLIAETLIEEETITSEQIYNLMNYGKLISPEDEVRAAEAKAKAAEQKLKDLEAGITQEDTAEEVHEDVQDSKEPDIDFDAALKELTKNDYDEHKE